jgi:hypothetical protein
MTNGGPSLNVELLSIYSLEPVSAVMQFALNCIPGQAHLHLAPLDAIGAIVAGIKGAGACPNYSLANRRSATRFIVSLYDRLSGKNCRLRRSVRPKTAKSSRPSSKECSRRSFVSIDNSSPSTLRK